MIFSKITIDFLLDYYKAHICNLTLNPYPESSLIYKDLIKILDKKKKFVLSICKKNKSNIIEISVQNMLFVYINRYIEEIFSFKDEVVSDMNKARTDLDLSNDENQHVLIF